MSKVNPEAIEISEAQQKRAVDLLRGYLDENFEEDEIGELKAKLLLNFISENIAKSYYNRGVMDAIAYVSDKCEDMYAMLKAEE